MQGLKAGRLMVVGVVLGMAVAACELDAPGRPIERDLGEIEAGDTLGVVVITVAPENIAELKQSYYTNLEVTPVIGLTHDVVFGVRENSPELLAALDAFIEDKRADGTIDALFHRYFVDRQGFRERVESEYLTSETGRLSEFDHLFRQHAPSIDWD